MTTIDEIDGRLRFLESEVNGEKPLSRYAIEQARLNSNTLDALATQVRGVRTEMTIGNAALQSHGTLLNILRQDVGSLRIDVTALRRGQEELHRGQEELHRGQEELRSGQEELRSGQEELRTRLDRLETHFSQSAAESTARLDRLETHVNQSAAESAARFDKLEADMNRKLDAVLAAVTPRGPI